MVATRARRASGEGTPKQTATKRVAARSKSPAPKKPAARAKSPAEAVGGSTGRPAPIFVFRIPPLPFFVEGGFSGLVGFVVFVVAGGVVPPGPPRCLGCCFCARFLGYIILLGCFGSR